MVKQLNGYDQDYWREPRMVLEPPKLKVKPPSPTSLEPPSWAVQEAKAIKAERRMAAVYFTCMVIYSLAVGIYAAMIAFGD